MNEMPRPKIDHQYWFDYSERMVESAIERRDNAALTIQKLVVWLWGIYTALASVGFALSEKGLEFWPTFIIAFASVSLIGVYWSCVWVQMPKLAVYDPRSPDDIRDSYTKTIVSKDRRLAVTLIASLVAGFSVSVALVVASVASDARTSGPEVVVMIPENGEERSLAISGIVPGARQVKVTVRTSAGDGSSVEIYRHTLGLLDNGMVQIAVPLSTDDEQCQVMFEWQDPSTDLSMAATRRISLEEI